MGRQSNKYKPHTSLDGNVRLILLEVVVQLFQRQRIIRDAAVAAYGKRREYTMQTPPPTTIL